MIRLPNSRRRTWVAAALGLYALRYEGELPRGQVEIDLDDRGEPAALEDGVDAVLEGAFVHAVAAALHDPLEF